MTEYSGPRPLRPIAIFNGTPYRRFVLQQSIDTLDITQGGGWGLPADTVRNFLEGPTEIHGFFERLVYQGLILKVEAQRCKVTVCTRRSGRMVYDVVGSEIGMGYEIL